MNEIEKLCKIKVPLFSKLIEKILLKIEVQGKIVFKDENFFKNLEFTSCGVEEQLRGIELQEKEEEKDKIYIGILLRKSP